MYYLCFASATKGNVIPAERRLLFIAGSKLEFDMNLKLAKNQYKNHRFECVKIRHDGEFHMEVKDLEK